MAVPADDEDWERVKLGRFSEADERLVRGVMGLWFLRSQRSHPSHKPGGFSKRTIAHERQAKVLLSRANTVAQGISYTTRKQALVKAGFCSKSRSSAMKQVLYVARLRPQDEREGRSKAMPVWDGFGELLEKEDVLSIAKTWDLVADQDNLSKAARTLLEQGDKAAFRTLSRRAKLRNIQTWHFILSIEEHDEAVFEPFRVAVRRTVDAAFAANGHKALWVIHANDTEHLHAHVIVKALSDFGGRIHSDIRGDYLHGLRETFAGSLRRVGLDYEATRRVDRKPLRDQVMAGQVPLSTVIRPWRDTTRSGDPYVSLRCWPAIFGQAAAENLKRIEAIREQIKDETINLSGPEKVWRAAHLLRNLLAEAPRKSSWLDLTLPWKKKKTVNENLSKIEWELLQHLEVLYHDPRQALESLRLMASEGGVRTEGGKAEYPNRGLAAWTLCHRPEVFGMVKAEAFENRDPRQLKKMCNQIRLWAPERLPRALQQDNEFAEVRKSSGVRNNRSGALAELGALHWRIEKTWPETWWARSSAEALRQAKRIRVDARIPYAEAPETSPATPTSVEKRSTAASTSGSDGGGGRPPVRQPTPQPSTQSVRKTKQSKKRKGFER